MSVNIVRDYAKWHGQFKTGSDKQLIELYELYKDVDTNIDDACIQVYEKNLDSFIAFLEAKV